MRVGLGGWSVARRLVVRPVLPNALVLVLVHVGVQRLFWLWFLARFPPNKTLPLNVHDATAYWQIWFGGGQWAGTLQLGFMITNLLLVLYLWAEMRGRPRGSFADRCVQLVAYGGGAVLLMYVQFALYSASRVEPVYRVIRLPLTALP